MTLTPNQMALTATAGCTASQMLDAGFTASQMLHRVPKIDNPYSTILADIKANRRTFKQSTWGPE